MSSASSALEFFILEASGYIDGLDSVIGSAGAHGPDRDAFVRLARALRGNSVMYRQQGITSVATALESCARAFRDGQLTWSPEVHAALVAAIDDLRILVRNVRTWGGDEDRRAAARAGELNGLVPRSPTPSATVQAATEAGGRAYLATKARELVGTVSRVSAEPADAAARAALAREVRLLSGVALLKEYPALAAVVAGIERDAAQLGSGAPADDDIRARLRRTAHALGSAAAALEAGEVAAAERALHASVRELEGAHDADASEPIVAINDLFYEDAGPTVVESSASPPTTAAARFRIEVVGLAEHARRVIADVRRAPDDDERERGWRSLERAFGALVGTARSFGETAVEAALGAWERTVTRRDAGTLGSLDEAAAALSNPEIPGSSLERRLEELGATPPDEARAPVPVVPAPAPVETTAVPEPQTAASAPAPAAPKQAEPAEEPVGAATKVEGAPAPAPQKEAEPVAPVEAAAKAEAPVAGASAATPAPPSRPAAAAPAAAPAPPSRPAARTPTGAQLRDLLQSGISELHRLEERPLTPPVPLATERVVPIETLVYSADAALRRAREIRDGMKARGGEPDAEELDELFALLDLVRAG